MKTLKSIILTSILTLTLVSCDMDKYPYDKIPLDSAAKSFADCQKLRTGMYRDLRIIGVSVNALASEIQADGFIPLSYFGNQLGAIYRWEAKLPQKVLFLLYGVIATSLLPNVIYSLKV